MPEDRIKRIREHLEGGGAAPLPAGNEVTGKNYLYAAARLGMVKKLYWVMPFSDLDFVNAEVRVRERIQRLPAHIPQHDIESLRFADGCVSGKLAGVETSICSISSLPAVPDRVVIAVNSGFFPVLAETKRKDILEVMRSFFDALAVRAVLTDSLHVLPAADGMARQGYVHDELAELFRTPELLRQPLPPALWVLRDEAETLLAGGGAREALKLLRERGQGFSDDPYLVLMKGTAELLLGARADGFERMERGCRAEPFYCRGLLDAGRALQAGGKAGEAARVVARIRELDPGYEPARIEQEKLKGQDASAVSRERARSGQ